ncbi:hypothetical protein ACTXM3_11875 [Glutamicibacter arilaitensis]|uniref:hypothetical protein n=1 Tax=Glutamicibacter arilaitensis TaxID=256701 RepID=UPI003F916416
MSIENLQVAPGTANPKAQMEHNYKTIGPGIPACTCGSTFEWRYEFEDHQRFYGRAEK